MSFLWEARSRALEPMASGLCISTSGVLRPARWPDVAFRFRLRSLLFICALDFSLARTIFTYYV